MSEKEKTGYRQIIFCRCNGERISRDISDRVLDHLKDVKADVTVLDDLCGIAVKNPGSISGLFKEGADILVAGCYQRTMSLLFNQVIEPSLVPSVRKHINLTETTAERAIKEIDSFCIKSNYSNVFREIAHDKQWPSWYPIIDYDRCTACGQCADFCLFSVYEKSYDAVKVVNPEGCKNNCPACARICPATAIIFPKYKHGGAIGGSDEIDEFAEQERQTKDINDILGGDIYSALESRKIRRKSIILLEAMRKANEEKEQAVRENAR